LIPKTIHQIWIGPKPAPKDMMETWRQHHPDWDYCLWNESNIDVPLRNQAHYEMMSNLGGKADILRYEILSRHGGIYVDADLTCLKPLDASFLEDSFFAAFENEKWRPGLIANGILGAVPGHPVMESMIERISGLDPGRLRESCPAIDTGPYALTEVLEAYEGPKKIYPSHWFYPEHIAEVFPNPEYVYARHDWYSDYPSLALVMVIDRDSTDLWRSLPRFKPHIASFRIGLTDPNASECRRAIESVFGNLPGEIVELGGKDREDAWPTMLKAVRGQAEFALVSESNAVLYDFRRSRLTADTDSYLIMDHCGARQKPAVRMVRADGKWRFSGGSLSSIHKDEPGGESVLLENCHMLRFESLSEGTSGHKGEEEILLESLERCPGDPETLFYLGQYSQDMGDYSRAIDSFGRCSEADGWPLQRWEACWRVVRCHQLMGAPWAVIEQTLMEAHRLDPERAEPLLELGLGDLSQKRYERASDFLRRAASLSTPERTFYHDPSTRQKALEQLNISAFYAERYEEGLRAGLKALQAEVTILPREQVINNIGYYLDTMEIPKLLLPRDRISCAVPNAGTRYDFCMPVDEFSR